jgi:hypothetical protein
MKFSTAARAQYLRSSYYTVFLVDPDGNKELLGHTQRRNGTGLMAVLSRESVQEKVKAFPWAATARFKKFKDRLEIDNGWKVVFGGTIRQEASE